MTPPNNSEPRDTTGAGLPAKTSARPLSAVPMAAETPAFAAAASAIEMPLALAAVAAACHCHDMTLMRKAATDPALEAQQLPANCSTN